MLDVIGAPSLEALSAPPQGLEIRERLSLAPAMAQADAYSHIRALAADNTASSLPCFIGAGAYRHYIPPAVPSLATRAEFLTAYTPYQAEASQGSLQAIYEWQTYMCLLNGLDVSNASVYDGATALVEGVIMAAGATGRRRVAISRAVHPQYRAVLDTYASGMGLTVDHLATDESGLTSLPQRLESGDNALAAAIVQSPNFFGCIENVSSWSKLAKDSGALCIQVVAEALSLGVLKSPGESGVDIAVGEAQSLGLPLGYGGPYVGFVAATKEHVRRMPGRLVGETTDIDGRRAYVLTLQGREQHIRRELATSNICTNQALCALMATVYLATVGAKGLRAIAVANLSRARELAAALCAIDGVALGSDAAYFNEFVVELPVLAADVAARLARRGILAGLPLSRFYPDRPHALLVCATETVSRADIDRLTAALGEEVRRAVAAV